MERYYIGVIEHGGGFGGGYGGTYVEEIEFKSSHRAGSRANYEDCLAEWRKKHVRTGWQEVKSTRLAD